MINYIVFDSDAEAKDAVDKCWIQWLKDEVSEGYTAEKDRVEYNSLSGMTDAQICALSLYGHYYDGRNDKCNGITTCYQIYTKAWEKKKWFLLEPRADLLALLSDYTVMTAQEIIDAGYYPPEIINIKYTFKSGINGV